jgi:hypothetical protein
MMPDPDPLSSTPIYLTTDSAAKHYDVTRYLVAKIQPDAHLLSGKGNLYPVWSPATVEAHLAGGERS